MKIYLITIMLLLSASAASADKPDPFVGIQADMGVPSGLGVGLALSPAQYWVKVTPAVTTNFFQLGWRVGLTIDPIDFPVGLSLTAEYGEYGTFAITQIVKDAPELAYSYINAYVGLELGDPRGFRFFLRAGPSWIFIKATKLQEVLENSLEEVSVTYISPVNVDLLFVPTLTLGFDYMLF